MKQIHNKSQAPEDGCTNIGNTLSSNGEIIKRVTSSWSIFIQRCESVCSVSHTIPPLLSFWQHYLISIGLSCLQYLHRGYAQLSTCSVSPLYVVRHRRCVFINYNWINQLSNTTIWWLDMCCLLHRYQLHVSALMAIFRLIDWQQNL